jgi:hypothetical protein
MSESWRGSVFRSVCDFAVRSLIGLAFFMTAVFPCFFACAYLVKFAGFLGTLEWIDGLGFGKCHVHVLSHV